jgi:GNAT superfamily N-acetyltransferase
MTTKGVLTMIASERKRIADPIKQVLDPETQHALKTVVSKVSGGKDLRDFISLPFTLMAEDPFWVPPLRIEVMRRLNPKRNPFFKHAEVELLLARRGKKSVARAAVFIDSNYDRIHGKENLLFGWFDCVNCQEVFSSLAEAMFDAVRRHNRKRIVGPFTFSINEEAGLLVEGFDTKPSIMTPHNPPWYSTLLEKAGFRKIQELYAYSWEAEQGVPEKLRRVSERAQSKPGTHITHVMIDQFDKEILALHRIYNEAFDGSWGHVPLTVEEFRMMGEAFRKIGEPRLVIVARVKGEPVGFGLSLPDWNQALSKARGRIFPFGIFRILMARRHIDFLRFIVLAISRRFRGRGLEAAIIHHTIKNAMDLGYRKGEMSMVTECNSPMRRVIEGTIGSPIYKRYRIFEKLVD